MPYLAIANSSYVESVGQGVSSVSEQLKNILNAVRDSNSTSVTFGWRDVLIQKADEILKECSKPNWDGYDGFPVSEQNKNACIQVIKQLPDYIEIPDVIPESKGNLALEWYNNRDDLLSISIKKDEIIYASSFSGNIKPSGREPISDKLSETIMGFLSKYFQKS